MAHPWRGLLGGLVLAWVAGASSSCVTSDTTYVKDSKPACCSATREFQMLANRSGGLESDDLLVSQLASLDPYASHFDIASVASRPHFEKPMRIFLKMHVRRIHSISQKHQQFAMNFDMYWRWRDCRLLFNREWPLSINDVHATFPQFWRPVVTFTEEDHSQERQDNRESLFFQPDGLVMLTQRRSAAFACSFDFGDLPFDTQTCGVTISLPEYLKEMVVLDWDPDGFSMDALSSKEWDISGHGEWVSTLASAEFSSSHPGQGRSISSLQLSFSLKRKRYDFVMQYVVPSFVYWLCSYGGVWVDQAAVPGRVALGLIPILTLNNKVSSLRSALPPINQSFRLENFMNAMFLLSVLQMMEFCVINYATTVMKSAKSRVQDVESARQTAGQASGHILDLSIQRPIADTSPALPREAKAAADAALLRWATWTHSRLDFHARWVFLLLSLICTMATLRPWDT